MEGGIKRIEYVRRKENDMNAWIESISEPIRMGSLDLHISYLSKAILALMVVICGVSLLLTTLWALGVWEYLWFKQHNKDRYSMGVSK